jgi:hypothetical protein
MDGMKLFVVCALCSTHPVGLFAPPSSAPVNGKQRVAQWQVFISEAAQQFGIPDAWIRGVMQAESGGRTVLNGRPITSVKGAMGLMQVMPGTYRGLRVQYGLGSDAYDPRDNIFAGAAYLRQMYERYGYPSLFAAYNAGPKRLDGFLLHGQSLPRATLDYVGSIVPGSGIALSNGSNTLQIPPPKSRLPAVSGGVAAHPNALFFARNDGPSAPDSRAENPPATLQVVESGAGFSPANSATLFVPLSGGSR